MNNNAFEINGSMIGFLCVMLFLLGLAIYAVCSFIKELKKRKADYGKLDEEIEETTLEVVKATAINKYTDTVYGGGYKSPKHRIGYFITFETEGGKTVTFDVGEEQFHHIKAYTTAELVTSEGNFIDFKE